MRAPRVTSFATSLLAGHAVAVRSLELERPGVRVSRHFGQVGRQTAVDHLGKAGAFFGRRDPDTQLLEQDLETVVRKAAPGCRDAVDLFYYITIQGYALRKFSKGAWNIFITPKGVDFLSGKGRDVSGEPAWVKLRSAGRGRKPRVPVA